MQRREVLELITPLACTPAKVLSYEDLHDLIRTSLDEEIVRTGSQLRPRGRDIQIPFGGHEPLDTDDTPTFEAESWLLNNGYTQAEGVANLDQVPEAGALVAIGFPKFQGGVGGYARFIAICPPDWPYGVSVGEVPESPLAKASRPLHWDSTLGMRVR